MLDGRAWPAWKLEPRLSDESRPKRPVITTWISADTRRLPVLIEVAASFGSVRVELTSYRER